MEGIERSGRQMSRSMSRVSWATGDVGITSHAREDEEALTWAAIEKLPTYHRLRTTIMQSCLQEEEEDSHSHRHRHANRMVVDVTKLNMNQTQQFIDRLLRVTEQDNQKFLERIRNRLDKVGITIPTVEVRFEHLSVEAKCHIGNRALPTLRNVALNIVESAVGLLGIKSSQTVRLGILKDVSGIVRPKRMALLLGPPSSGKTTLLLALAGKLDPKLEVNGEVTYNGHRFNEFVPQKTSAYISQNDFHIGALTVKETLDFSARCQGPGTRYALLNELIRREKQYGITPEPDVDLFMKATSIEGTQSSLITDYTLKILGLDICRDTIVGDNMIRGVSGGQKKRVTTGEMIVGPTNTLFMDEISTGLDSSTTFQIVKCMQQIAHLTDATILMSLLQPDPETFNLFDDVFLLSEGHIVYQGPRDNIIDFFETCGFRCPDRKGTADFLQEVTSIKDQEQYWSDPSKPYRYVSVTEFVHRFKQFQVGVRLENDLLVGFNKSHSHPAALVLSKYTIPKMELLQACFDRECLLLRKNYYIYVFKFIQLTIMATILSTVFIRTKMHHRNVEDGILYIGAIMFSMIIALFNGISELAVTIFMLPVFYKQRDLLFHPAWAYTLPCFLLGIPITLVESAIWGGITYYAIGFAPEPTRFFKYLLIIFLINQAGRALYKFTAAVCKVVVTANTGGALVLLVLFLLGGFVIPRDKIPFYWAWAYWITPLSYTYNALAVNEMFAPRWMNEYTTDNTPVGLEVLKLLGVFPHQYWYWIGVAALSGFTILFNLLFTLALAYLNPVGRHQAIIPNEDMKDAHHEMVTSSRANTENSSRNGSTFEGASTTVALKRSGGMVLPFTPLAMTFHNVNYYVDMPVEMKAKGVKEDKLQLLKEVTGSFRPGVLTTLMGVSGAGKTTLMDVLAGRKTSGYIDGDIKISGFPKKQETFARISGYCEQNDIHSPQLTVEESLIFSASLRLPKQVSDEDKLAFVKEVMELVELDIFKDALVGLPGITGLSTEQRKRLTIAVELVANPSIIFMDEPTSGLDARAAAIVMRSVRKTVDTGRTVVCTIHQPSIDIFEAFDEMLLLKRGGQVIYSGPLGRDSQKLIEYFEAIPGVPKIKDKYNPAMWMLEVSSVATELQLGMDFAEYYKSSYLYERNVGLVMELSSPAPGAHDVLFSTKYSQTMWGQFKSCFWKQWWTYWRSPEYNLVRLFFTLISALIIGSMFWKIGHKIETAYDLRMVIGAMYSAVLFIGVNNCSTVQPVVDVERSVFYRERAAGMYSSLPYAIAMVICEVPYVFVQATYYTVIVYAMMGFEWTAPKFLWFFFISFFSFLYFTYYGMMTTSITPNQQVAAICAGAFYALFNLFSGFYIPRSRIPKWWVWYYWICPIAWTVYGLIVSQYGDSNETIQIIPGLQIKPTIKLFIKYYYGYNADFLGVVALVLVGFTVFFAFIFSLCIRILNFQTR